MFVPCFPLTSGNSIGRMTPGYSEAIPRQKSGSRECALKERRSRCDLLEPVSGQLPKAPGLIPRRIQLLSQYRNHEGACAVPETLAGAVRYLIKITSFCASL